MPVLYRNDWAHQFYRGFPCPENTEVPTHDADAYRLNPEFNWVYNKLLIGQRQGLVCAPHGIEPEQYPVFSRPCYNLGGSGFGAAVMNNKEEYAANCHPGYMWAQLLTGEQFSTDVAVIHGQIKWMTHVKAYPGDNNTIDYWEVFQREKDEIAEMAEEFVCSYLGTYSGMVNFETIGNQLIEVHLRFAYQWPDLYSPEFISETIRLYARRQFKLGTQSQVGYSLNLYGPHQQYKKPNIMELDTLVDGENVTSIQLPFHENIPFERQGMPLGGFHLGIINGHDRKACEAARKTVFDAIKAANPGMLEA